LYAPDLTDLKQEEIMIFRLKYILLALVFAVSSMMTIEANAQAGGIAKLAKEFSVSPKLLTKFSKAGLSRADLGSGLQIAKEVANVKDLKIDDAVEQVLSLKEGGKDWPDIAKNFGVELPKGMDALEGIKKLAPE
jgi:hypothetical protein